MSRSPSPAAHWDRLETWLSAMTYAFLPRVADDLQQLSREQLDDDLNQLMTHDPTQSYSHKEWAKIVGRLAHNLIVQTRLSEHHTIQLEQETTALKLQAEEARRNQADAQTRLDRLLFETQERRRGADETNVELKHKVERLQDALTKLCDEAEHREQLEREHREDLNGELQ